MKIFPTLLLSFGATSCCVALDHGALREHRNLQKAADDNYSIMEGEELNERAPGILVNDMPLDQLSVEDITELGDVHGRLRVDDNGRLRYRPDVGFWGTVRFNYDACLTANPNLCDTALVTIQVTKDPNRPDKPPGAINDKYRVTEGRELRVSAPGFLGNDLTFKGNELYRKRRFRVDGSLEGDIDTHSDGRFEYEAPTCWTGNDVFGYEVCYRDYDDLCAEARVTIEVTRDPNRPDPPRLRSDSYTVKEGVRLEVREPGILANDDADRGQTIYVYDDDRRSGFRGDLDVHSRGNFEFFPEPGAPHQTYYFDYEVCYRDWDCVDCRTSTVSIRVDPNPDKPDRSPTLGSSSRNAYQVEQGQTLVVSAPGFLRNANYETKYTLDVDKSETSYSGSGDLTVDDHGGFEFEADDEFQGIETFTYRVCYVEWPDLCSEGTATIETKPRAPDVIDTGSRTTRALAYVVRWAGEQEGGCDDIEPSVELTCGGEGVLTVLGLEPSDREDCVLSAGVLRCPATDEGIIYAQCAGPQASVAHRQLNVKMHSDQASDCNYLDGTFHVMWMNTWCAGSSTWVNPDISCTGAAKDINADTTICYEFDVSMGGTSQVKDVTMVATPTNDFDVQCSFGV